MATKVCRRETPADLPATACVYCGATPAALVRAAVRHPHTTLLSLQNKPLSLIAWPIADPLEDRMARCLRWLDCVARLPWMCDWGYYYFVCRWRLHTKPHLKTTLLEVAVCERHLRRGTRHRAAVVLAVVAIVITWISIAGLVFSRPPEVIPISMYLIPIVFSFGIVCLVPIVAPAPVRVMTLTPNTLTVAGLSRHYLRAITPTSEIP